MDNADVFETYHSISEEIFSFKGALWKARLLPWSDKHSSFVQETSSHGGNAKFAHINHIVVSFSHVNTDGYSCMRIMKTILSLFNDTINGVSIDDQKQIGTLLDVNREKQISEQIKKYFSDNPDILEEKKMIFSDFFSETVFEKAYPVLPNLKPKTVCLVNVVEEGQTMKFINRCKDEGCSVHTGFCALVEAAAITLMQEAGFNQNSYLISSAHAADNRVYYDDCYDEYGYGIGTVDMIHEVEKQNLSHFWNQAKAYHKKFKKRHAEKAGIENEVITELIGESPIELLSKEGQSEPSKKMFYYGTSNMRDITGIFAGCGDNIELEFLDRLTTSHLLPCIWTNVFNTFRGRFYHSLQYNSHIMSPEVAKKYSDKIFELFEKVVEV